MISLVRQQLKTALGQLDFLFMLIFACCFILGITTEYYFLFVVPLAIVLVFQAFINYRSVYWLAIICIPMSTELFVGGGVMIDFPVELLMIFLTGIALLIYSFRASSIDGRLILHPVSLLLLMHVAWMIIAAVANGGHLESMKYILAKSWYLGSFFFMSLLILKPKSISKFVNYLFYPLLITVFVVVVRHALVDFSFEGINKVLSPFYRNHVNYAALLAIAFPFLFYLGKWPYWLKVCILLFFLFAIYTTYTRAAYIALICGMCSYWIVRYKLIKWVIPVALGAAFFVVFNMIQDRKYLDYAPDFESTVSHTNFDDLLEATYQMTDVSTMERLHRWIAGMNMIGEKPLVGFGPGRFFENYKRYTVSSFSTYISDNEERSGIHSYYLMTALEQGLPGLIIYLLIVFLSLLYAEKTYHRLKRKKDKLVMLAVTACMVIIHLFQIINDLLEADKVGPIFLICLALVVRYDLISRESILESSPQKP